MDTKLDSKLTRAPQNRRERASGPTGVCDTASATAVSTELDPENETGGEGGALPLERADGAGAGHEADTEEAQCGLQGQGGAGGNQGRSDDRRAGLRVW